MDGSWPVRPIELPGRGIGLVAARDIAPGELIISEEPLILYPNELLRTSVCGCCLRMLSSGQDVSGTTVPTTGGCGACGMRFCSAACEAAATTRPGGTHRPCVCKGIVAARQQFKNDEEIECALFLLMACDLLADGTAESRAKLQALEELTTTGPELTLRDGLVTELKTLVHWAFPCPEVLATTAEQLYGMLKREARSEAHRLNTFSIMAPVSFDDERTTRGTGVYPRCARMNHSCFPNAARFDDFDAAGGSSTAIMIRAMDGLKAGAEVLTSYFQVSWGLEDRQERLEEEYGFACRCERCKMEMAEEGGLEEAMKGDSDSDGGGGAPGGAGAGAAAGSGGASDAASAGGAGGSPLLSADPGLRRRIYALWFLKFMCPEEGCGGSLAPPSPTADTMVCNYCGRVRTDKEFFEELEDFDSEEGGGGD